MTFLNEREYIWTGDFPSDELTLHRARQSKKHLTTTMPQGSWQDLRPLEVRVGTKRTSSTAMIDFVALTKIVMPADLKHAIWKCHYLVYYEDIVISLTEIDYRSS